MSLNKRDCIVPNIELLEYDFKKGEMIGSGSFGSVFNAYSKKMKGFTALKVLHNDPTNFNNESNNEFIRE
ncbi:10320_t:CDS:1, partial [Gigaspora margarita]